MKLITIRLFRNVSNQLLWQCRLYLYILCVDLEFKICPDSLFTNGVIDREENKNITCIVSTYIMGFELQAINYSLRPPLRCPSPETVYWRHLLPLNLEAPLLLSIKNTNYICIVHFYKMSVWLVKIHYLGSIAILKMCFFSWFMQLLQM